jgi:hypothetical protein
VDRRHHAMQISVIEVNESDQVLAGAASLPPASAASPEDADARTYDRTNDVSLIKCECMCVPRYRTVTARQVNGRLVFIVECVCSGGLFTSSTAP